MAPSARSPSRTTSRARCRVRRKSPAARSGMPSSRKWDRSELMKILVLGGTGTVGSAVVRALLPPTADVRVVSRSAAQTKGLPEGAKAVIGDLLDIGTIRSAFRGMDGVFIRTGL